MRLRALVYMLAGLLFMSSPGETENRRQVDLLLALAIDISGSMSADDWKLVKQAYVQAFEHPDVIDAIENTGQVAVVIYQWSNQQHVAVDWRIVSDEISVRALASAIEKMPRRSNGGVTLLGQAVVFGTQLLETAPYRAYRKVLDVSGDGVDDHAVIDSARDAAVALGIVINGLPIEDKVDYAAMNHLTIMSGNYSAVDIENYYKRHVIGGPGAFNFLAHGYSDVRRALRDKLVREIASAE